jgi:hypothetical protein
MGSPEVTIVLGHAIWCPTSQVAGVFQAQGFALFTSGAAAYAASQMLNNLQYPPPLLHPANGFSLHFSNILGSYAGLHNLSRWSLLVMLTKLPGEIVCDREICSRLGMCLAALMMAAPCAVRWPGRICTSR